MMNVFAIPGEVFEEIKASKATAANWVVPVLIMCLVSSVAAYMIASQPAFQQKIREQQEQKLDQQVKAGKMTRQQADQASEMMQKFTGPTIMKIFGVMGAIFYSVVRLFWWATALWLLGRWFLRVQFGYGKAMEVAGLAGMIGVLGTLVTLLLQMSLNSPTSSTSLALMVSDFDPKKVSHMFLAAINIFVIWQVGVLACALARLAAAPFIRAALVEEVWLFRLNCSSSATSVPRTPIMPASPATSIALP